MKLLNATEADWLRAIAETNEFYDGNLQNHPHAAYGSVRLTVHRTNGPGTRRSHTGRRIWAACWHAHRDVMWALFEAVPDAKLVTAVIRYDGKEDFEQKYPDTGLRNIGSVMEPIRWRDACDC